MSVVLQTEPIEFDGNSGPRHHVKGILDAGMEEFISIPDSVRERYSSSKYPKYPE